MGLRLLGLAAPPVVGGVGAVAAAVVASWLGDGGKAAQEGVVCMAVVVVGRAAAEGRGNAAACGCGCGCSCWERRRRALKAAGDVWESSEAAAEEEKTAGCCSRKEAATC